MSTNNENRVLNRIGAHELTEQEADRIGAGFIVPTLASAIITGTATNPDDRLDT